MLCQLVLVTTLTSGQLPCLNTISDFYDNLNENESWEGKVVGFCKGLFNDVDQVVPMDSISCMSLQEEAHFYFPAQTLRV